MKRLLDTFRADPILFVRKVLRVNPSEQQKELLRAIAEPQARVSVRSGHGTGKTSVLAMIVLWFLLCFKRSKVGCTAPTKHQLGDNLWGEIRNWYERMPKWFQAQLDIKSDKIKVVGKPNQYAVARTAKKERPEALQGLHAPNMLFIIDEASGVHDIIFEPVRGTLTTEGARIALASNPTRTSGFFFDSHNVNRDRWTCLQFSCLDSPFVSEDYIQEMKDTYGEDSDFYRKRVLGEFPRQGILQLIPRDLVDEAVSTVLREEDFKFAPKLLGIDPAWEGDDRTVIALRQGLHSEILASYQKITTPTLVGTVSRLYREKGIHAMFIDVGMGTGLIDGLRSLGLSPIPVNSGEAAYDRERFLNRRIEMWWKMLEWLQSGASLPNSKRLIADLTGPEYGFTINNKMQLERKRDMKKRGLASPDEAEAVALTFAHPVEYFETGDSGSTVMAQGAGYNPLDDM